MPMSTYKSQSHFVMVKDSFWITRILNCCLCSDLYKWWKLRVFSDKDILESIFVKIYARRVGTQYFLKCLNDTLSKFRKYTGQSDELQSNWNHVKKNATEKTCERRRHESLGGSGGIPPQKIFKSESFKMPFPALSCRKLCQKGSERFLLWQKRSLSSDVTYFHNLKLSSHLL